MSDATPPTQLLIDLVEQVPVEGDAQWLFLIARNDGTLTSSVGRYDEHLGIVLETRESRDLPDGTVDAALELVARRDMTLPSGRIVRFSCRESVSGHHITAHLWPARAFQTDRQRP